MAVQPGPKLRRPVFSQRGSYRKTRVNSGTCICSAQSKNRYDSGIVPAQSRNPTLSADSGIVPDNSRIAQGIYIVLSSDIICAQSRNRVGQSRNLIGSAK